MIEIPDSDWVVFPISQESYCIHIIDRHFQDTKLPARRENRTLDDGRVITRFGGYSCLDFPGQWFMTMKQHDDIPDFIRFWAERIAK